MFQELLEAGAVDKNHSRDIEIVGFHQASGVQAPILITLGVRVMAPRLLAVLGGHDRRTHDRAGVRDTCMSLRLGR
jgi:cyanophycinase-like exopeptidase